MQLTLKPTDPQQELFEATLVRAKAGHPDAINVLFKQFYPRVKRLVHHSLSTDLRRNRPWLSARFSTGDVVQEVFRTVLTDIGAFGGQTERAFAGYLAMVVRNRIIDAIRFHEADRRDGRIGSLPLMDHDHASKTEEPVSVAANAEELERYRAAMESLPESEQLLLRARFEGVASFAELTEQLGYSSVTSARRAFVAAQAKLAVQMRPKGSKRGDE